jgi:AraC family transcriptional regulator of adaptative response/methylated-DNA-[protein]-cysteine methyltransferase
MTETSALAPQSGSMHAITYSYGESSLGIFLAAIDEEGVCAILFGDDRDELRRDLQARFPDRKLETGAHMGFGDTIIDAVASLIEQPASSLMFQCRSVRGDFEQMLYAALRQTKPGTVKCIFRPVLAGRPPIRKSLNAGPVWVPPPSHWPTT